MFFYPKSKVSNYSQFFGYKKNIIFASLKIPLWQFYLQKNSMTTATRD